MSARAQTSRLPGARARRGAPDGPVVVVGGGIAGLATAALLAHEGRDVTLVEATDSVGGRAGSWSAGGFRFDTGPSWYLMPEVFDHFFRLCGTSAAEQLDLVRLDPGYRVYFEGHAEPVDIRSDREASTAQFESLEPGAGATLGKYLDSARTTYDLALRRFLYTNFTSYPALVRPDVLARAGTLVARLVQPLQSFVARRFTDRRIQQILGYPAVFLGSSPYLAPSIYHLMSHLDLTDGVLYPRGGFTELIAAVRRVAEAQGVRIHTGTEAVELTTTPASGGGRGSAKARAQVTGVRVRDRAGQERTLPAGLVVGAADLHHLETRWLPESLRTYPQSYWDKRTPGPGALLLLLGVRGELPQLAHHTLLFTEKWEEGFDAIFGEETHIPDPASLYVCRPSATDAEGSGIAPAGHQNLFVLVPIPADPGLGRGGVDGAGDPTIEAAADQAIAQIAAWTGIGDLAERVVVRRTIAPADLESDLGAWRGTALGPAHTLTQSAFFRTRNVSKHVDGLYYAGASTIPGIGLPMCLISAELILKHLRGDTSTAPVAEPGGGTVFDRAVFDR
ncbi:phytoene desaturase family protein [Rhodococcus sp. IEGM 1408]|uniref:phytoene desaturase family protein n=1 Tax=Rhodococcus sp. IEGM 1408 TaxID=3082220 RepID=UPI002955DF49|nr:phytoene desaturase family protein [Rhodococcus sp. IEGM 1408]MDV8001313.1 phytoene desaturase family protein [Rhodococcus sp. IEGM 1408]